MTDEEKFALHQRAEAELQSIAHNIRVQLPPGICFALFTFTPGHGGYTGYISNAKREDMVIAIREAANKLEQHQDSPHSSHHGRRQ